MMKHFLSILGIVILTTGCASSDRMVRMSGGVLGEYSAPSSYRIRSEKYQKMSRELSSPKRANQTAVSGMDDTLINIWPFFFRTNAYWSVLWPFIDKDPYGFAIRPLYNQEGDDYSVLFPLAAWNPARGDGWVTLWAWNNNGCGLVPFFWKWDKKHTGGAWLFPLFFTGYDHQQPYYKNNHQSQWNTTDRWWFLFPAFYSSSRQVSNGDWGWLYHASYGSTDLRNEWNYRFNGQRPYPKTTAEMEKFRSEKFAELPRIDEKTFGILPFYGGTERTDGSYDRRYMLLVGTEQNSSKYEFDIMGELIAKYKSSDTENEFTSILLLSHFKRDTYELDTPVKQKFDKLEALIDYSRPFNQQKPAISDALKALDPALDLPKTVVDYNTYNLFIRDLRRKYTFLTAERKSGSIFPLFWYENDNSQSAWAIPLLLSWGDYSAKAHNFTSLPLLSWANKNRHEESTTILARLGYYSIDKHLNRRNYQIFDRKERSVWELNCCEQRDMYVLCGLFYRGKYGFNVVKSGYNAQEIDKLRYYLNTLCIKRKICDNKQKEITKNTNLNDRWQTKGEIERLKKLIRYEELKIQQHNLQKQENEYQQEVQKALNIANKINFPLDAAAIGDQQLAAAACDKLLANYTELRFKEDIGNGLFFRKENFYNGDYNWHLLGILAGGERIGNKESTHILHLLYRYRKEGERSERVIFPFISTVQDGNDSRVSFLWRVFSLSKRNGKTSGHILFIPFGKE